MFEIIGVTQVKLLLVLEAREWISKYLTLPHYLRGQSGLNWAKTRVLRWSNLSQKEKQGKQFQVTEE